MNNFQNLNFHVYHLAPEEICTISDTCLKLFILEVKTKCIGFLLLRSNETEVQMNNMKLAAYLLNTNTRQRWKYLSLKANLICKPAEHQIWLSLRQSL